MASGTGFSPWIGPVIIAVGLVITLAFFLYFDGLRKRTLSTSNRSKLNVLLHFPLHMSIIVMLQGLRNNLISLVRQAGCGLPVLTCYPAESERRL